MTKAGKRSVFASVILVKLAVVIYLITSSTKGFGETMEVETTGDPVFANRPYILPDYVTFAGERMPLEFFDTRESLDRELLTSAYRHSSTIMIIKRANRYLPVIEKILEENGIPDDFKYLVAAESEFANAVSPKGATGFWQIMAATGREAGLEINAEVDERYHLEKSTMFACDYIRKSFERFGSWTLAAASYNGGRAAVDEQIRIQKENNYYDLLLTEETARYVFRVVAYKLVISDPANYGFDIPKDELYPPLDYYEVRVDTAVSDFAEFAKSFGTNYKLLKFLNPWLRKPSLMPRPGREYTIKIPSEGMRIVEQAGKEF